MGVWIDNSGDFGIFGVARDWLGGLLLIDLFNCSDAVVPCVVWHYIIEVSSRISFNVAVIGNVIESLDGTDISIVKLNRGLRYTNETFSTATEQSGHQNKRNLTGLPSPSPRI